MDKILSTSADPVNSTDELFKSASYLTDCYLPSSTSRKSTDGAHAMHAPFNVAFNTVIPYFEWLERPGNEARLKRFGPAMTGTAAWEVPGAIIGGQLECTAVCGGAAHRYCRFPLA